MFDDEHRELMDQLHAVNEVLKSKDCDLQNARQAEELLKDALPAARLYLALMKWHLEPVARQGKLDAIPAPWYNDGLFSRRRSLPHLR